ACLSTLLGFYASTSRTVCGRVTAVSSGVTARSSSFITVSRRAVSGALLRLAMLAVHLFFFMAVGKGQGGSCQAQGDGHYANPCEKFSRHHFPYSLLISTSLMQRRCMLVCILLPCEMAVA